jgi:hypothetical protein
VRHYRQIIPVLFTVHLYISTPIRTVTGNMSRAISANACAFECDQWPQCKGVFYSIENKICATLAKIIVTDTGLAGESYLRGAQDGIAPAVASSPKAPSARTVNPQPPQAPATCNSSNVNVVVRRRNGTSLESPVPVVAVHLVEWTATPAAAGGDEDKEADEGLALTLSNVAIFGQSLNPADCSWPGLAHHTGRTSGLALKFSLLAPQDAGGAPHELPLAACLEGGNKTVVVIPRGALMPWALLKIST